MTPTARRELHDYCERARRVREAQAPKVESWTFADKTDAFVFVVCMVGAVFFIGWKTGEMDPPKQECPIVLPDGRELTARHLGPHGDEKCTYSAPRLKWRKS